MYCACFALCFISFTPAYKFYRHTLWVPVRFSVFIRYVDLFHRPFLFQLLALRSAVLSPSPLVARGVDLDHQPVRDLHVHLDP